MAGIGSTLQDHVLPLEIIERIMIELAKIDSGCALKAALVHRTFTSIAIKTTLLHGPTPALYDDDMDDFFKMLFETHGQAYNEDPSYEDNKDESEESKKISLPFLRTNGYCLERLADLCKRNRHVELVGLDTLEIDHVTQYPVHMNYFNFFDIKNLVLLNQDVQSRYIWKDLYDLKTLTTCNMDSKAFRRYSRDSRCETFVFYDYRRWYYLDEEESQMATSESGLEMPFVKIYDEDPGGHTIHIINLEEIRSNEEGGPQLTKMIKPKMETDYELYHYRYRDEDQNMWQLFYEAKKLICQMHAYPQESSILL